MVRLFAGPDIHLHFRTLELSRMGNTDGHVFASSSDNSARGLKAMAKKVQVEPTLSNPKVADLKKGEELRKPRIHDPEFSARRIRLQPQQRG